MMITMRSKKIPFTMLAAAFSCMAQEVRFNGLVSGWVADPPTQSIRLIAGLPGAALLGKPLVSDLAWASTSPGGTTAIALRNGETKESVILRGETISPIEGAAISEPPQFAAWTADGRTVSLLWTESRTMQVIRIDTDGRARAESTVPIANLPETGAITSAAALPNRLFVAVAGAGVFRIGPDDGASATLLYEGADCRLLAVAPSAERLWTVDGSKQAAVEIPVGGGDATPIFSDAELLFDISALQISTDRKWLYLANATKRKLYRLNLEAHTMADAIDLDIPATVIQPLLRPSLFLLGTRASNEEPLYIWDESSGNIYFVPGSMAQNDGEVQ
jgi:hypothetical protein